MLKINKARLLGNLESLAQIGRTPAGGVSRPALSESDAAGRAWFKRKVEEAGLRFKADEAGNLSAILPGRSPTARTLLAGSHLDTVANGGRYDGALGVLAVLESLQTIKEAGLMLPVQLEAISFTDEEGTVTGMLGSRALTGQFNEAELKESRQQAEYVESGLARLKLSRETISLARRAPESLAGYVELHIEQGTRLEEAGLQIGVVTSIVGIRSYWLTFRGEAAHAGTTPMDRRADALLGAAELITVARELVMTQFSQGVVNFGQLFVAPGAFNIVPAEAQLALEFRHESEEKLEQMEQALLQVANDIADRCQLSLSAKALEGCAAAQMDRRMIEVVEEAAAKLELGQTRLLSLAGHDAQNLSRVTPSVLYFVPSVDGVSHNPQEYSRDEDVINGANVMLQTLLILSEHAA